jgi:hypothetical protein
MTATMQKYRRISKSNRDTNDTTRPIPRCQFILDLQAWLDTFIIKNYSIILAMDANEEYKSQDGSITPLTYKDGQHIKHPKHDGHLATLCKSCGLVDPFTIIHTHSAPPPMYIRGSSRLDYTFVTASLIQNIERAGIFPYNSVFFGDHRPCFVDFSASTLF